MAEIATKSTPRRVTIKKRDDFDGYGNAVLFSFCVVVSCVVCLNLHKNNNIRRHQYAPDHFLHQNIRDILINENKLMNGVDLEYFLLLLLL